jgi:hypothetical protein
MVPVHSRFLARTNPESSNTPKSNAGVGSEAATKHHQCRPLHQHSVIALIHETSEFGGKSRERGEGPAETGSNPESEVLVDRSRCDNSDNDSKNKRAKQVHYENAD